MKVTALKAHPRKKSQVKVYLDGKLALNLARIIAARLRVGQELDETDIGRLQKADAEELAYDKALKFLATRPRSEAEVRRRLRESKVEPAAIEAAVERLRGAGLVDDKAFASYWAENRAVFRPKSKRALLVELKRKGVQDPEALGQALEGADDHETAYRLASKRAKRMQALSYADFYRKLGGYLARRGFDFEVIELSVKRVWNEIRLADRGEAE